MNHASEEATLDGASLAVDGFARFENRCVTTNPDGRVHLEEQSYEISHEAASRFLWHGLSAAGGPKGDSIYEGTAPEGRSAGGCPQDVVLVLRVPLQGDYALRGGGLDEL